MTNNTEKQLIALCDRMEQHRQVIYERWMGKTVETGGEE